jgi:hypothetical protein
MTPTISLTLDFDHPALEAILTLAGRTTTPATSTTPDSSPTIDRDTVLTKILAADLNDGEIGFLQLLANASPETVPYSELFEFAGSGQKLGNITSGLFRRWRSRGGADQDAPWGDVNDIGRAMPPEVAALVLARFTEGADR